MPNSNIAVFGAGSWGTALAYLLAENQHHVQLWSHDNAHVQDMQQARCNTRYFSDIEFPENLTVNQSPEQMLAECDDILIVVPSFAFKQSLETIAPFMKPHHRLAWASKGLDPDSGLLLHELVNARFPKLTDYALLSGPTFAKEVIMGLPTAMVVASPNQDYAQNWCEKLSNQHFRAYYQEDIIGVALGGAVKNILAVAAGIADGLAYGANARSALITRGLAEMLRLGIAMGGKQQTFMGLAGLGDLTLTCTDNLSRNRRFGLALGQGMNIQSAIESINQVVEGYGTSKEIKQLADKKRVDMPIVEQVYKVLYENRNPKDAVNALFSRELKSE